MGLCAVTTFYIISLFMEIVAFYLSIDSAAELSTYLMCGNSVLIALMDTYAFVMSICAKGNMSEAAKKTNTIILYSLLAVAAITSIISTYMYNDYMMKHNVDTYGIIMLWIIIVTVLVILKYCLFMATILFAVTQLQDSKFSTAFFPYHVVPPQYAMGQTGYYPVMDKERNMQFTALQVIS